MLPKLLLKALSTIAHNPEVRRRVIAAANNPEMRRKVVEAGGKGVDSLRRWWGERESLKSSDTGKPLEKEVPRAEASAEKRPGTTPAKSA